MSDAGAVTAKITLDTSEFDVALDNIITRVSKLNQSFGSFGGGNLGKTVDALQKKIQGYKKEITSLERQLRTASNGMKTFNSTTNATPVNLKRIGQQLKASNTQFNVTNKELATAGTAFSTFERNLNTANLNLDKTSNTTKKLNTNINDGKGYIENYNNALNKMYHSWLGIKTIMTMIGGMYIWQGASELVQSVKDTIQAKSEMESQLSTLGIKQGGITLFNKALDDTAKKFQKINKYQVGETVSSIGLEFQLSAKEMANSMDVISMITSEYIRAGRNEDEAALAVKDILQGEFQRLSRETGIGKDDLQDKYGWDGDLENITGLMEALRKAGKARHWDVFAQKATSLNDVLQITKNRFSEFGAEVAGKATPLITGAFNTLLDIIGALKSGFEGLSGFWQNALTFGTLPVAITGLLTVLPMVTKGFSLAEIASIGWSKSILTMVFNLEKATVAEYGFRKALVSAITGIKASEMANIGAGKALMSRILGVDKAIVKEHGFLTAMVQSKAVLNGTEETLAKLGATQLSTGQKLAFLTGKVDLADAKNLKWHQSLLKVITSTKLLKIALIGLTSIAVVAWLASLSAWTDKVKKNVEGFYNVVDNGKDLVKDAKDTYNNVSKEVDNLNDKIRKYNQNNKDTTDLILQRNRAIANEQQAYQNIGVIQRANAKAQEYSAANEKRQTKINLDHQEQLAKAMVDVGNTQEKATYLANDYYNQVLSGNYYVNKGMTAYEEHLSGATAHARNLGLQMKEAKVDQDIINQFMADYNMAAEEAAEHWKKFNEGDMMEGAYAILAEMKQAWIEISYNKDFRNFMKDVTDWYNTSLKPILTDITGALKELGKWGMGAFSWLTSTDLGKHVASITVLGTVLGVVALKVGKWVTGSKSVFDVIKRMGGKLKDLAGKWKDTGDKAEEANTKMGGSNSTGGINGNTPMTRGEAWQNIKGDFYKNAQTFARLATQIVMAAALVTEAIYLIQAPMWGLAEVGKTFKAKEKSIQAGIDGLKLVAPTILALLVPMTALMYITDKFDIGFETMGKAFLRVAAGIAMAIGLVTEALLLLNLPLMSLALLGGVYGRLKSNVDNGIKAMDATNQALRALVPWIPVFIAGIALAAVVIAAPEIGIPALVATAGGVGLAILAVSGAIAALSIPLEAIGQIGDKYPSLSNVEQGAKALSITAECLGYVESSFRDLAAIKWELIAGYIADLVGKTLGINLTDLTVEGGFFDQLDEFTKAFNKLEFETPLEDKVTALSSVSDGMKTIGNAMKNVKTAMDNLPEEFKNGGAGTGKPLLNYDVDSNQTAVTGQVDVQGYFDTFKQPLRELKKFIDDFNTSSEFDMGDGISQERVDAINNSANMISSLDSAVQNVKTVMQNVSGAGWETNVATNGIFAAMSGVIGGLTDSNTGAAAGVGSYSSSMGSSFQEMENIIKDMTTFTNNISGLTGESSNVDVSGLASIVQQVSTQINNLKNTISNAVPTLKTNSKGLGSAIGDGLKEGFDTKIASVTPQLGNKIKSLGTTTLVPNFKNGIDKMSEAMGWELYYVGKAIDDKYDELGEKAYNLAKHMSDRFKEGDDMHSPGIISRTIQDEMGYIGQFLDGGLVDLPQKAFNLANALSSNFNFDLGLSNIQLPDLTQFTQGLSIIPSTVGNVKTQVSTNIQGMVTNVGNSLMNMKTNAVGTYNNIVANTRTSLNNMQSQTTKNISGIKTSWRGMQTALIASAEAIRSQTQTKINKIKTNLGDFWNKVKHPDQLISGSAGGHTGSIRRKYVPHGGFAGNAVSRSQSLFKPKQNNYSPDDMIGKYMACILEKGEPCYAGSWSYNWTPSIVKKFKGWNTHFGKFHLDNFLNVGKFENSNFPVKGNKDVAKSYIFDVIRATRYGKYFDSNYGDDPVAALKAGVFNCWDGTTVVLAIARAFGFEGSRGHGTWNGIGHVWANIPGLGIIDPTAIQNKGSFTSSAVRGYSAGSIRRGEAKTKGMGETYNYNGDMIFNIYTDGNNVEVDNRKLSKETGRQIIDIMGINPATGR